MTLSPERPPRLRLRALVGRGLPPYDRAHRAPLDLAVAPALDPVLDLAVAPALDPVLDLAVDPARAPSPTRLPTRPSTRASVRTGDRP
ncbi:hypothetical protein [Streptomyces sp. NPDC005423]|uniref:hypothetical protein n=1 Tax=Streptomyces sp. NPDC005423 TaxID=3155343 RepID=UPI0033AC0A12